MVNGDGPTPQIPDFEMLRPIGCGGFGQVWLAKNRATGKLRAVKVISLRRGGTSDPAGREISSITRLEENVRTHHPNLLSIHHVGKTAEHLFYVMDPADDVSGTSASSDAAYRPATLRTRLHNGPLTPQECFDYARQLLAGLAALHEAGMVHRDVKPANCLFVDGELKLADFGLLTEANPQVSRLGTQKYMPPDGRMDTRADVYAAGLVIYEMVTGLPADGFPRLGEKAAEIARSPIFVALNRLVLHACQGDPERRFADARQMLSELETPARETLARWIPPRPRVVVSLTCLIVAFALSVIHLSSNGPPDVEVNFITEPYYEATVYLDDQPQYDPAGEPYKTPCTIPDLPPRIHHVKLKRAGMDDLDVGRVDFARMREIVARWESPP